MVKPQQPEPLTGGDLGRVPEDNQPGHHPAHEQDKPSGRDFVAKTHALAHEDDYVPPSPDDEVLDLTELESEQHDPLLVKAAGFPFAVAGRVLSEVRKRLP